MNTPLKRLAAVMFASLLSGTAYAASTDLPDENDTAPSASVPTPTPRPDSNPYNQGTTADGRTIVAPGTYGPFQGPTCEAGSSGCSPASTPSSAVGLPSDPVTQLESPLQDIGTQQRNEAVMKMEDDMVKNGTYQSLQRDPSGKGAVITLPNGMIAYSDYVRGLDTMPKTPEQWAADPNAPKFVVDAARKIIYDQANNKMFAASSTDKGDKGPKMSMLTEAGSKTGGNDETTEAGASDNSQDDTNPNTMADVGGMGGQIAANYNGSDGSSGSGLSGPGGPNGGGASSDRQRADNQRTMQAATKSAVDSAGDGEQAAAGYTYERLAREAREGVALKALRNSRVHSSNGADQGDNVDDDKATRGTSFFGR